MGMELTVHKAYDLLGQLSSVPSFKDKMDQVVTSDVVDSLYQNCRDDTTIVDNHMELVPLPDSFWGTDYLNMSANQRNIVAFLFRKRLSLIHI